MSLVHFIVDPLSEKIGKQWPHEQPKIESITKDFCVHLVRGRGHAESLTIQAISQGAKLIVCVGGDAALSEIANALLVKDAKGVTVATYPRLHTGNFIKCCPSSSEFEQSLKDFLTGQAKTQSIDLGRISFRGEFGQKLSRYFLNYASFGFSSFLLHKTKNLKSERINRSRFWRFLFQSLPFYKIPAYRIQLDEEEIQHHFVLTGFINNSPYAMRNLRTSAQSQLSDGKIEFTEFKKTALYRYFVNAVQIYAGQFEKLSFVNTSSCEKIKIEPVLSSRAIRVDFDGECRGYLPADFSVVKGALRILQ